MAHPPLGWIAPKDRTQAQHDAHAEAMLSRVSFALPYAAPPKGTKVILTAFLAAAAVVADTGGKAFDGFHQLTGSCVGCSAGNAVAGLSAVQRMNAAAPQKAIIPWWGHSYGQCRRDEGDRGPGEGAVDSVMGQVLHKGVVDLTHPKLAGKLNFKTDDGWYLDRQTELHWSDPRNVDPELEQDSTKMPVGSVATANSAADVCAAIINGYVNLNGCSMFIQRGSVKGEGENAYVAGRYDGNGGHSTCYAAYWNHPNDGELLGYWNQWPTMTYPRDPAGLGRCMVWTTVSEVEKSFRMGSDGGESLLLSNLKTFPAQPEILSWFA